MHAADRLLRVPAALAVLLLALYIHGCAPSTPTETSAPAPTRAALAAAAPPAAPTVAAAPAAASAPLNPPVPVRYAIQYSLNDAPTFLALERGYFAAEGLDVELIRTQAAGEAIPQLATGGLDVAMGSVAAGFYNAVARGAEVRVVADSSSTLPGFPLYSLVVRKDLVDSGRVRDWADLKGLRIANVAEGNGLHRGIDEALRKGGGSIADIEMVLMPTPDMIAAFANRAIDAAPLFEPYAAQGEEQGVLVRWRRSDDIFTQLQGGAMLYSPLFIQQQPEAAQRLVYAYLRGIRDYNDAFTKNRDRAEVSAIIVRNVGLRDPAIMDKVYPPGINPDGYVDAVSLRDNQEWFAQQGLVQTQIDMDRVIDNRFVDAALARLGRYSTP